MWRLDVLDDSNLDFDLTKSGMEAELHSKPAGNRRLAGACLAAVVGRVRDEKLPHED